MTTPTPRCCICDAPETSPQPQASDPPAEHALVASNVRAFSDQQFSVWRCARCGCIHSGASTEVGPYYVNYPYHRQRYDLMTMLLYDVYERRLRRGGVGKEDRILDYGCGSGHLLRFLRWKGFKNLSGYDAYSESFGDASVLELKYDCVIAQDVLEHVEDPRALLQKLSGLLRPGGRLVIGTPEASAIDLRRPNDFRHTLHQPYHRHLLSWSTLKKETAALGMEPVVYFPRPYANTIWPFLNQRFMLYYARCFDDTMDLAFDGLRFNIRLLSPWALFLALFGFLFSKPTDLIAVFRAK